MAQDMRFLFQMVVSIIVLLASLYNLTFGEKNFDVWLFFASSVVFTIMPHPKPKKSFALNENIKI